MKLAMSDPELPEAPGRWNPWGPGPFDPGVPRGGLADLARWLERPVLLAVCGMRRAGKSALTRGPTPVEVVQVRHGHRAGDLPPREVAGLVEAMDVFDPRRGIVVTEDDEWTRDHGGRTVEARPLRTWLLEREGIDLRER